jgi:hypothetical protein
MLALIFLVTFIEAVFLNIVGDDSVVVFVEQSESVQVFFVAVTSHQIVDRSTIVAYALLNESLVHEALEVFLQLLVLRGICLAAVSKLSKLIQEQFDDPHDNHGDLSLVLWPHFFQFLTRSC